MCPQLMLLPEASRAKTGVAIWFIKALGIVLTLVVQAIVVVYTAGIAYIARSTLTPGGRDRNRHSVS